MTLLCLRRFFYFSTLLSFFIAATIPHAYAKSCCELTEQQLQAMRGRSDSCPSSSRMATLTKCMECPPNTCRVGLLCYCPGAFLSTPSRQRDCEDSFLSVWPQSIGKEDRFWRSCAPNFEPPEGSTTSCCDMTEDQLEAMVGTSDICPSSGRVETLAAKCLPCPPGSCRLNSLCYCPSRFAGSSSRQRQCADSFGEPWPKSIGMEDMDWRSCNNSAQPVSVGGTTTDEGTTTDGGTSGVGDSGDNQGSSVGGSTSGESTSNTATATSSGSKTETTVNVDGSSSQNSGVQEENSLTTLEIVGIVAGVVSAVVTVIGSIAALKKRKQKDKHKIVGA